MFATPEPVRQAEAAAMPPVAPRTTLEDQAYRLDLLRRLFQQRLSRETIARLAAWEDGAPAGIPQDVRDAINGLVDEAGERVDDLDAWLTDLDVETTRLLVGPAPAPAQPYASVYLSPGGLVMSDETLAVRQSYLDAGVLPQALNRIPDDHLGLELDFLWHLTTSAAQASQAGNADASARALERRAAFVRSHVESWVPRFASAFQDATKEVFLKLSAALLVATVEDLDT